VGLINVLMGFGHFLMGLRCIPNTWHTIFFIWKFKRVSKKRL